MPSLPSNPAPAAVSPCDVFATASELQSQLAALEKRTAESEAALNELRVRRAALQHELYSLEVVADAERTTTRALHAELETLQRDAGADVVPFTFVFPAQGAAAEPNVLDDKPARLFARNVIPESWKKQLGRTITSNANAHARLAGSTPRCVSDPLAREYPAKSRKMRRTLSEKLREKRKKAGGNRVRGVGEGDDASQKRKRVALRR